MNSSLDFDRINRELTERILARAINSGNWQTEINGLILHRRDWNYQPENHFYNPCITVIVQGSRSAFLGESEYHYKKGQCLILSVGVPSVHYSTAVSPDTPFLAVSLEVNSLLASELACEMPMNHFNTHENPLDNVSIADVDIHVLDAFSRLLALLDSTEDIPFLSPLLIREIHYRILRGHQGVFLRQVNTLGTQNNQIAQAVTWLRKNFRKEMFVNELAEKVNMAPSTFFRHFRKVTTLSPIQFQKRLRLCEAQRLICMEHKYATTACLEVGYENPKQFSREYKRFFGHPPSVDTKHR